MKNSYGSPLFVSQISVIIYGISPNESLPRRLKGSQYIMSYCYRCICPSELDGNTPLLKTQHIFVIRHREIKLELTWNHPPFLFTFIVLVNALESNVGERHQWHPRSQHPHGIISMCHVNFAHSQQWSLWELSTAFGLNLKHAPQKGFQSLVLYINLVNILGLQGSHALEKTLLPMKL